MVFVWVKDYTQGFFYTLGLEFLVFCAGFFLVLVIFPSNNEKKAKKHNAQHSKQAHKSYLKKVH